jgi:hypothetical protein
MIFLLKKMSKICEFDSNFSLLLRRLIITLFFKATANIFSRQIVENCPQKRGRNIEPLSRVFRLANMGKNRRTRPWSAHESRISADPVFHMRQRHWEGLVTYIFMNLYIFQAKKKFSDKMFLGKSFLAKSTD